MTHSSQSSIKLPDGLPTIGQLERKLSQAMQSSYRKWTGHSPERVLCHVAGRVINVLLEGSVAPFEALLHDVQPNFIRDGVHEKMRCLIAEMVIEIFGVSTHSVMLDSDLESGLTGIIILLTAHPKVRASRRKSITQS